MNVAEDGILQPKDSSVNFTVESAWH